MCNVDSGIIDKIFTYILIITPYILNLLFLRKDVCNLVWLNDYLTCTNGCLYVKISKSDYLTGEVLERILPPHPIFYVPRKSTYPSGQGTKSRPDLRDYER